MNNVAVFATPSEQAGWSSSLAYAYRRLARHLLQELPPTNFHIHRAQGFGLVLATKALSCGHKVTLYRDLGSPLIPPHVLQPLAESQVVAPTAPPRVWVRRLLSTCDQAWCLKVPHPRSLGNGYNGLVGLVQGLGPYRDLSLLLGEV